ncbi:MAG: right-handed parallel beta-helix repeat-containing protein [Rhizonema sp. PD38]|nr:right-handed parallel beta-helix repeat-containing protein [Rhizonema sp. PD38]
MNFTDFHSLHSNTLGLHSNHIIGSHNALDPLSMNGGNINTHAQDSAIHTWVKHSAHIDSSPGSSSLFGQFHHSQLNTQLQSKNDSVQLISESDVDPITGSKNTLNSSLTDQLINPGDFRSSIKKLTLVADASPDYLTGGLSTPIIVSQTSSTTTSGATYYVSPDGNDSNPGTADQPWQTVNYAVSTQSPVQAGDTILVQPGTYTERITLGKSGSDSGNITLKANGDVTLDDPDPNNGSFQDAVIQSAGKGYWVIDGFRIENTAWAGICLRDANNMTVQNNHTYQTAASGIIIMPNTYFNGGDAEVTSKNIKVLNNTIERALWKWQGSGDTVHTQESLSMWGVDGFEVANNIIKDGNKEGLDLKVGTRNGSAHDNTITGQAQIEGTPQGFNGGAALYLDGSRAHEYNIDVYNNVVANNTADGIVIADEAPTQGEVSDIRVYNNVVYGNGIQGVNGGAGVTVTSNVRDVTIVNNTIDQNVQAFVINGKDYTGGYIPHDIVVRNNIFADSSYRNGYADYVNNLTFDHNLFTNQFSNLYEGGTTIGNLQASDNNMVPSIGFVNASGDDFHLSSSSPALGAGSTDIDQYAQLDKDSLPRIQGNTTDIGAYK